MNRNESRLDLNLASYRVLYETMSEVNHTLNPRNLARHREERVGAHSTPLTQNHLRRFISVKNVRIMNLL